MRYNGARRLDRRDFLRTAGAGLAALMGSRRVGAAGSGRRPNLLLLTADDMNWDALGVAGCTAPNITPNLDRLAGEGVRFTHAHVTIAVCQPSRSVLMTGRYPHRNGAEGFEPIDKDVPTLEESLHAAGYLNGILGKVRHLAPSEKFCWDFSFDQDELGRGRDPKCYYERAKAFFERAKSEDRPFFLMANSHDPHRPFAGSEAERRKWRKDEHLPSVSRHYKPEEIEVPGFLPDLPDVRKEVAEYYTSVHRCDETVGAVLRALRETGFEDHTLVMFLSDNGMALPFAKTNCYLNSTSTPWIVRWPDRVKPGGLDDAHFISGIDFMPTCIDAAGLDAVPGMDGRSFLPVLLGEEQKDREEVFTQFHLTSGKREYPMRCVQDARYGYIYNAWSDGKTAFKNESQAGLTMKAMKKAAEDDAAVAERVRLFLYRVPEELYDFAADPNGLENLAKDPAVAPELDRMRRALLEWMQDTQDPLCETFAAYLEAESESRSHAKARWNEVGNGVHTPAKAGCKEEPAEAG